MVCDNINNCHDNIEIAQNNDGVRYICKQCKLVTTFRIDENGRMNTRQYGKVFKRDTVQPGSNLYYKVHPEQMSLV